MAFPATGLPDLVTIRHRVETGVDEDDNVTYAYDEVIVKRPARHYADVPKGVPLIREGFTVTAMVAFKAFSGDPPIDFIDECILYGPQFPQDGTRHWVIWPYPKMLWKSQSHWELAIGTAPGVYRRP